MRKNKWVVCWISRDGTSRGWETFIDRDDAEKKAKEIKLYSDEVFVSMVMTMLVREIKIVRMDLPAFEKPESESK